jgi:L-cysteine S-thiosulfotransferase
MNKTLATVTFLGAAAIVAGCATAPAPAVLDQQALAMMKASFRDQGIAKVDRLNQDLAQQACSADKAPAEAVAKRVEAESLASIKWPSGGQYLGDWRAGEKLAQSGVGMAWNNPSAEPAGNGGQCYNCHEINRAEVSSGTIGPTLWNYGKTRGVKNVTDPAAAAVIQYTWGKLWNSKAYSACSNMPRFGHMKLLNEQQIRDVMALLLDPASPVNR